MKTITFNSEKGGVGKSTFSILFADWLQYVHGVKVGIADYDFRISDYRKDEITRKKRLGVFEKYKDGDYWDIATISMKEINSYNAGIMYKKAYWLQNQIDNGILKDKDVILIDLPGSISGIEVKELLINRMISMCVIPMDRDTQTIRATLNTYNKMTKIGHVPTLVFLNQIQSYVRHFEYERIAFDLSSMKEPVRVLPDMISYTERIRKISEPDIIKSTLEWPDWNNKAFEGSKDLGLENLFIDITKELDKVPDLPNTRPTDLGFVYGLKKEFQEKRQLLGTCFPEYEFDKSMFSVDRQKAADALKNGSNAQ